MIVVEEHIPAGGLWSAISAWKASKETGPKLIRIGPPDALALGNLQREELRRRFNCDAQAIAKVCRSVWRRKP